jgi:hypothetical protein
LSQLYNSEEGKYPEKKKNNPNCFYGNGWKVEKVESEYFLFYLDAAQGGNENKMKITSEMFLEVQEQPMSLKEIFKKYKF